MVSRLVLGCGTIGYSIVEAIADWTGSLFVVDGDAGRVEALRNENVSATCDDPTDRAVIEGVNRPVDVVLVAADAPIVNLDVAKTAREVYPDALFVVYTGRDPPPEVYEDLTALGDRVVEPARTTADRVVEVVNSEAALRSRGLQRVIRRLDGTLGVFMHDNPDPDAIASAVALKEIAASVDVAAEACYFGDISHQENRAFVNLLDLDLRNVTAADDLDEFAGIALVDHSRPGVNDNLPEDTPIDIVIDHHPPKQPIEASFIDIRDGAGATSTLLVDHLRRLDVEIDQAVATGLLYGIRVDTKDFTREVVEADFEAAAYLLPLADVGVLEQVESPSVTADTLDTIAAAIRNRTLDGSVLASCVGSLSDRDTLAQAADRLLTMEDVTTTLVYGFKDETVYVSARAQGTDVDLGEVLRAAFGRIGSAGGHADMAGAQIPLGLLGEVTDEEEESLTAIVSDVVTERFFDTVRSLPASGEPKEYHDGDAANFEYPLAVRDAETDEANDE